MRTIRASEIGTFVFCHRAWWYQRKDVASENQAEMAAGKIIHHQHGRTVMTAGCLRYLAIAFLIAAVLLLLAQWVLQVVP